MDLETLGEDLDHIRDVLKELLVSFKEVQTERDWLERLEETIAKRGLAQEALLDLELVAMNVQQQLAVAQDAADQARCRAVRAEANLLRTILERNIGWLKTQGDHVLQRMRVIESHKRVEGHSPFGRRRR